MSFSNPRQNNNSKGQGPSDKLPKGKKNEYMDSAEYSVSFSKKTLKNQDETSYYRESHNDDLESSQISQKSFRSKNNKGPREETYDYEGRYENGDRERRNYNKKQQAISKSTNEKTYYYVKKNETPKEEVQKQEDGSEVSNTKKGQNEEKRQQKERKDKNKESLEKDSKTGYEVVYYVKKSQTESNKGQNEEHKGNDESQKEPENKQREIEKEVAKGSEKIDLEILSQVESSIRKESLEKSITLVKASTLLLNERDKVSQSAPKPVIEIPPKDLKPVEDDKDISPLSIDTENSTSNKQASSIPAYPQPQTTSQAPASAEQQRIIYPPAFQQIPMFHAPYIVFPQPNGISIIQPLYHLPSMNIAPQRSEEEQGRIAQPPLYLVPSAMVPNLESAANPQVRDNIQAERVQLPHQFFPGFPMSPAFMAFPHMQPSFVGAPIVGSPVVAQTVVQTEVSKSNASDTQSKDDAASDRRDD